MQVSTRTRRPVRAVPEFRCWGQPDLFFADDPRDVRAAKALCQDCPMRAACLAGALERGEPFGVWGGELFERGRVIAEKRPRGRPRRRPLLADPAGPRPRLARTA